MDTQLEKQDVDPQVADEDSSQPAPVQRSRSMVLNGSGKWVIPLIVLACAGLGISAYIAIAKGGSSPQVATTSSANEPTVKAISALGRLEPQGEVIKVAAPASSSTFGSARVAELRIKEGDTVQKGQIIAVLDTQERATSALLQAESQVQESERRLAQVKAGAKSGDIAAQAGNVKAAEANVERIKAELSIAEADNARYQELHASGAVSDSLRDSFRLKADSLRGQLMQAEQQVQQAKGLLSSTREVRPTDVQLAEAQVQTALINVRRSQVDVELSQVRSPISGQILKVNTKEGEVVGNNGVVEVGNTQQMYVVAEIYETDISKVKVGQKAAITSEAFDGEVTGTVDRIGLRIAKNDVLGTDPAAKTDVRIIEVKIRLNESKKVSHLTNLQVKVKIQI